MKKCPLEIMKLPILSIKLKLDYLIFPPDDNYLGQDGFDYFYELVENKILNIHLTSKYQKD